MTAHDGYLRSDRGHVHSANGQDGRHLSICLSDEEIKAEDPD